MLARSGLAIRHGVTCLNAPGLIDSGFRGEVQVVLVNTDPHEPYTVHRGDRIAQLVIVAVEVARFFAVETLPESERGRRRLRPLGTLSCRGRFGAPCGRASHVAAGYHDVHADVAQLVEHHLAKVRVAGSSPVVRSRSAAIFCR